MKKLLILLALLSPALHSQNQPPTGRGLPGTPGTLTRSGTRYRDLESRLLEAMQDNNAQALSQMVADDFQVWSAEKTDPTPREQWQQQWFASRLGRFRIREIAVREFGDIAVVNFLLRFSTTGKSAPSTLFVVDVWNQPENKLLVRYVSAPAKPAASQLRKE